MKYALNIIDWQARAPGLATTASWLDWSQGEATIDPQAPHAKLEMLPMMTARRLNSGSRLAVECGMSMLNRHTIDAILFTSRHGELERNWRILQALATNQTISPTDFAMSVHNSAVGNLTIATRIPIVSSSLSAGQDTFQQGLCEVQCLLQAGYQRILMVDFDGNLPDFYAARMPAPIPDWAFAVALVIERGESLSCQTNATTAMGEPFQPQSLIFLHHWLSGAARFSVPGEHCHWEWSAST